MVKDLVSLAAVAAAVSALTIWLPELPAVPLVQAALLTSFNGHYWDNFPTAENNYVHPGFWWATDLLIVAEVHKKQ